MTLRLTPAQEAAYALDFGVSRADLKPEVQTEYDRQLAERLARPSVRPARDRTGLLSVGGRPVDMYRPPIPRTPGVDPGRVAQAYARIMMVLSVLVVLGALIYIFAGHAR